MQQNILVPLHIDVQGVPAKVVHTHVTSRYGIDSPVQAGWSFKNTLDTLVSSRTMAMPSVQDRAR